MDEMTHILIMDDDADVRRLFEQTLKDTAYRFTIVDSGKKGIAALHHKNYQLVFLGLNMPNAGGLQALQKIRELSMTLPVYIVASFHRAALMELDEARKMGLPFQLLKKPIGRMEILALTQSVLSKPIQNSTSVGAL